MCTEEKFMKVTRWEKKLLNVLFDPIKETIDERKIESKLNYYYQSLDTQDLVSPIELETWKTTINDWLILARMRYDFHRIFAH